jgi:branched-chain amino acid transport system substrate-binding protein
MRGFWAKLLLGIGLVAAATSGLSERASAAGIKIGVVISQTGPGASLGVPQAKTVPLLPKEIAGQSVEYIVLDDGSDATKAVANARKLITDDQVDALIGGSITPASIALVEVAAETKTPFISLAGSSLVVSPMDEKKKWVFKSPQNDALMAAAIADHMAKNGVKSVGFIGFSDAYGDGWLNVITPLLEQKGIKLVAAEKYARADTSVTGQILKILAAKPDVVLIAGAGTPAALPAKTLRERGFTGVVYQTHGAGNNDFLRVGGKDVEGTIMPAGPVLVAAQLPDSNPSKKKALEYVSAYEAANGKDSVSTFGAHIFDADILLQNAAPVGLKAGKPGTPEFRAGLRDALEGLKEVVYSHGVATMTPTDHVGQDARSRVMVTVENGHWKLLQ